MDKLQGIKLELDRITYHAWESDQKIPARHWLELVEVSVFWALEAGVIPEVLKAVVDAQTIMVTATMNDHPNPAPSDDTE